MSDSRTVTFKYQFADDYNPVYINGAYGGVGSRGEVVVNFYFERPPVMRSQTHELSVTGEIGEIVSQDPSSIDTQLIRFVQTGVAMNLDTAKRLHEWLGRHINTVEQFKETTSE